MPGTYGKDWVHGWLLGGKWAWRKSSWGWIRRDVECHARQLGFILHVVRE